MVREARHIRRIKLLLLITTFYVLAIMGSELAYSIGITGPRDLLHGTWNQMIDSGQFFLEDVLHFHWG